MREPIEVLHVDDEPDFAELTAIYLEREDDRLDVETAPDATAGLERLREGAIDCVVSDYDMPGQNGIEFLEAVREEHPDLPFILFTGKGSEEIASEAISAGVTDYLQKEGGTDQYAILANRIENAVEASRTRMQHRRQLEAIETAQEGISILDEDGRFVYVNRAYADLYGYEPEEMLGEHWGLLYREEDVEEIREDVLPEVEREGHWHGRTIGLRADGTTFLEDHVLATTATDELVCTVRDITDQQETKREYERTSALLSTLFDTLPVGVLAEDASREVLAVNDRLFEMFGFDGEPADLIGQDCERLAEDVSELFVDPEGFVDRINELVAARQPVDEERLELADGRTFVRTHRPIELPEGKGHLWVYREANGAG